MASRKTPERVNDSARPEFDLSQVLAHGPALCSAYGRVLGSLLVVVALMKTNRGTVGLAAVVSVLVTAALNFWR